MRLGIISMVVLLAVSVCRAGVPEGIYVEVTGGQNASFDRIVEQEMNLDAAGKLLGRTTKTNPQSVRVVEIGPAGESLAAMVSQVDAADKPGSYIVCWQAAGELGAGQTRRFKIVLDGAGEVPAPAQPVSAVSDGTTTTVTSGKTVLTYSKDSGGMLTDVKVDSASGQFLWMDKVYDGVQYFRAAHPADSVRLISSGPLRVVYETEGAYSGTPSRLKAVYRFTHYAGEPVVYLTAEVTQDYGHQWISLHFVEIHFSNPPITHYVTDLVSGKLTHTGGDFNGGKEWAAIYGENLLLGVLDSSSPGIYDGAGGKNYGAYIRSGVMPMTALSHRWKCSLYVGGGPGDRESLGKWSTVVSDTPAVKVSLGVLDAQIAELTARAEQQRDKLSRLDDPDWADAYIQTHIARNKLCLASDAAGRGEFDVASDALAEIQAALENRAGESRIEKQGEVVSGIYGGYPFLLNNKVACFWSRPEQGAGLISIYDRQNKREFLNTEAASAPFWEVSVKKDTGGKSYTSAGTAGKVEVEKGRLKFAWGGPLSVQAQALLAPEDSLLRLRLTAVTESVDEGLLNVNFPTVTGILPITAESAGDVVLDTRKMGDLVPSPLISGTPVEINYPAGMQFTALQGGSTGLYFADEDPEANRKTMRWSPDKNSGTLSFTINRPVLGWGGTELVKKYASSGDMVIGPFNGDWYDAAQIYRKWALTAPWTAKGPIHTRKDIPKWLANATYWTIGSTLSSAAGVNDIIEDHDFLGPGGIIHGYNYYLSPLQDNLYPEVWPPRIGSEGFKKVVNEFHKRGMRIVLYISGLFCDQDTEAYRTQQAAEKGQIMNSDGGISTNASYGSVQFGQMCPGSKFWQDKLSEICSHGVARYGVDGWYFDYLTLLTHDCFNPDHGHPIAGGNYWTKSVRELYSRVRNALKAVNPDTMITAETNAEFVIDLLDTQLTSGETGGKAPIYPAVYHDYSLLWGGGYNQTGPCIQGRWWLMGGQNGWHNIEGLYTKCARYDKIYEVRFGAEFRKDGAYYRRLLDCHRRFGLPYLSYGRMLRMPRLTGDLPRATCPAQGGLPSYTVPAVEGTAWQAPDKTVGIFFLNYLEEPQEFTWTFDLSEAAGWGAGDRLRLSRWTEEGGLQTIAEIPGGKLTRSEKMEGREIMALKLEVIK